MDRKVKIMFSVLLLILAMLAVFVIVSYINVSQQLSQGDSSGAGQSSFRVFLGENGKYGVRSASDEEIITPQWNKIEFLADGKFLAENESSKSGIIDSEQNTIFPFIGESVSRPENGLVIIGTIDGEYVLFDASGKPLSDEVWDSCEYNEGKLRLSRDDLTLNAEMDENAGLRFFSAVIKRRLFGVSTSIEFNVSSNISGVDYRDYEDMANISLDYVQTLLSGKAQDISGKIASGLSGDIIGNYLLTGCKLIGIDSFEPSITDENGKRSYTCKMSISYHEISESDTQREPVKINQTFQLGFSRSDSEGLQIISRS